MAKESSLKSEEKYERRSGIFILVTIVIILIALVIIGKEKKIFKKKYRLLTTFEHGRNVDNNTRVSLAGLNVGNVTEIYINDDNKVEVVMSIRQEYQDFIKEDSVATLVFSLLKGSVIDISFGGDGSKVLADGDRILLADTEEIADKVSVNVLMPKSGELRSIVENDIPLLISSVKRVFAIIDDLVNKLGNSSSNLNQLVSNLEEFSGELNDTKIVTQSNVLLSNAGVLTNDLQKITSDMPALMKDLSFLLEETSGVLGNVRVISDNIKGKIPALPRILESAEQLLNDLKVIAADLKGKSPALPRLIESAEYLVDDVGKVLDAAKKSFLLRKHFKKIDKDQVMIYEEKRDILFENVQ